MVFHISSPTANKANQSPASQRQGAKPALSLFHQLLLYVEDNQHVALSELPMLGDKRQLLGALGRLEGLHYLERATLNNEPHLVITEDGDALLSDILANLPHNRPEWDGRWRLILFDIPESMRTQRQLFRLKLMESGARMLQSSVWITPFAAVLEQFHTICGVHNMNHLVHSFEASHLGPNPIDVAQLWSLSELAAEYTQLFKAFETVVKQLPKSQTPSFVAKSAIIQLALLTRKDPFLPPPHMPEPWIGLEANQWYQRLRSYCK